MEINAGIKVSSEEIFCLSLIFGAFCLLVLMILYMYQIQPDRDRPPPDDIFNERGPDPLPYPVQEQAF